MAAVWVAKHNVNLKPSVQEITDAHPDASRHLPDPARTLRASGHAPAKPIEAAKTPHYLFTTSHAGSTAPGFLEWAAVRLCVRADRIRFRSTDSAGAARIGKGLGAASIRARARDLMGADNLCERSDPGPELCRNGILP